MRSRALRPARPGTVTSVFVADDGRHPPHGVRLVHVADGIRATVDADQPAGPDTVLDRAAANARAQQLPGAHEPVLAAGQRRDQPSRAGLGAFYIQVM